MGVERQVTLAMQFRRLFFLPDTLSCHVYTRSSFVLASWLCGHQRVRHRAYSVIIVSRHCICFGACPDELSRGVLSKPTPSCLPMEATRERTVLAWNAPLTLFKGESKSLSLASYGVDPQDGLLLVDLLMVIQWGKSLGAASLITFFLGPH